MAWDDDGCVVLSYLSGDYGSQPAVGAPPSGTLTDEGVADKQAVNDESNANVAVSSGATQAGIIAWYIFFPEKRELDGYYWNHVRTGGGENGYLTHSENSTNGKDGTFTAWGTQVDAQADVNPDYRNNINSSALSNKRCVYSMIYNFSQLSARSIWLRALHVYGRITPGETPDRLIFLDTENVDSQYTVLIDYGDLPRGQTKTYTIKIKNNSTSLTANTVQLIADALSGNSDQWYSFSVGGGSYVTTAQLGAVGPGGTVLVTYKQAIPDAEVLGLHAARFKVNQASWS